MKHVVVLLCWCGLVGFEPSVSGWETRDLGIGPRGLLCQIGENAARSLYSFLCGNSQIGKSGYAWALNVCGFGQKVGHSSGKGPPNLFQVELPLLIRSRH